VLPAVRPSLALVLACFVGGALPSEPAQAAPPECFAAADDAQNLRDEGHYAAARERLAVCSAAACPEVVQRDCSRWIEELVQMWPTIIVRARDLQGRDLADVKVSVDGKPVADRLEGTPLQIDPGEHLLACESEGAPPVKETIVVRATAKNRIVDVQLAKGAPPAVAARMDPDAEPRVGSSAGPDVGPQPPQTHDAARTLRWVFGGATLAAFGTAAYFGWTGLSRYNTMKATCATNQDCNPSNVSFTQTHFLVSDVSVGIGLASAAAATYFFLTSRSLAARPATAAGIIPAIGVAPVGATLGASGVF
jgi:hypothetical protein